MKRTITALISRGLDSQKAESLANSGWTVSRLKLCDSSDLMALGLSIGEAAAIHGGARPPVPFDTLTKLLFDNRYCCCVCRNGDISYIVHHIVEWSKSRSHDPDNLAVLCLEHHSQAHSRGDIRQNLTQKLVKSAKFQWENEVKEKDSRAVVDALKEDYAHWAYINELRVIELMHEHSLDLKSNRFFARALRSMIIDEGGVPAAVNPALFYMYEGAHILDRYFYMKECLAMLLDELPLINISDYLDRGTLHPTIVLGDFILVQGAHTFSPIDANKTKGKGQHCRGYRQANGVRIEFSFDRWMATSSSSLIDWLSGTKGAASVVQVKNIERVDGLLLYTGTALAIASFVDQLKTRSYERDWRKYQAK